MSKAKEFNDKLYCSLSITSNPVLWRMIERDIRISETQNHKTLEDVKELIETEFKKGGDLMEHRILTELEKLKL